MFCGAGRGPGASGAPLWRGKHGSPLKEGSDGFARALVPLTEWEIVWGAGVVREIFVLNSGGGGVHCARAGGISVRVGTDLGVNGGKCGVENLVASQDEGGIVWGFRIEPGAGH